MGVGDLTDFLFGIIEGYFIEELREIYPSYDMSYGCRMVLKDVTEAIAVYVVDGFICDYRIDSLKYEDGVIIVTATVYTELGSFSPYDLGRYYDFSNLQFGEDYKQLKKAEILLMAQYYSEEEFLCKFFDDIICENRDELVASCRNQLEQNEKEEFFSIELEMQVLDGGWKICDLEVINGNIPEWMNDVQL